MIARGSCLLYVRVRIVQALTRRLVVCHGEAVSLLHGRGVERQGHPVGQEPRSHCDSHAGGWGEVLAEPSPPFKTCPGGSRSLEPFAPDGKGKITKFTPDAYLFGASAQPLVSAAADAGS